MAADLGAHEVMEMHEVLTDAIDGINQFQLYRPHVQDQALRQILEHQIQFMTNEYNMMVQMLHNQGAGQAIPYRSPHNTAPRYGLQNPPAQTPNASEAQMDDRDVASGMLGCHKSSSIMKMMASLECANPQLRRAMQQGAVNCSEQAYEVWQYMNQNGYYQVPTMKQMTTDTVVNTYQPASGQTSMPMQQQMNTMHNDQMSH